MTETELLKEILEKRFISFTKDDTAETFASRNKLAAYDLIEETKPNHWILTKDGYKAIELGFEKWLKFSGNNDMTLYDKIPLQLERSHFIDIIPLFPDVTEDTLRNTCHLLKKDGIIEIKGGRILAFGIGDKIYAGDLTPKIECRLLRDNKITHATFIDKSVNLKDSMYVGGDNSGNMDQSSNFSNTNNINNAQPVTTNTKPATDNPAIKKSLLNRIWTLISENKLISGIILLLLGTLLTYLITGSFGGQNNE